MVSQDTVLSEIHTRTNLTADLRILIRKFHFLEVAVGSWRDIAQRKNLFVPLILTSTRMHTTASTFDPCTGLGTRRMKTRMFIRPSTVDSADEYDK